MYPPPDSLCIDGPEGHYCHEIIVPFIRRRVVPLDRERSQPGEITNAATYISVGSAARTFPPGSEWIYLKAYGGSAALDDILHIKLPKLVNDLSTTGHIARWFFVRYADPDTHLRIRFHCVDHRYVGELHQVMATTFGALVHEGLLWKVQFDTYEREIERYGGLRTMLVSEDIFCADSDAILEILQFLEGDEGLEVRWRLAVAGIDMLLSDCGFDIPTRLAIVNRLRADYSPKDAHGLKQQLGNLFREERPYLEAILSAHPHAPNAVRACQAALARRSTRIKSALNNLNRLRRNGNAETDLKELVSSYSHMHVNRLLRSDHNAHEFVIYDFLSRLYEGARVGTTRPRAANNREPI